MTYDAPEIVTGRQAADLLDVPPKRVAVWIERGKVAPVGLLRGRSRGGRGVPTFHLADFRPLATAYHARRVASSQVVENSPAMWEDQDRQATCTSDTESVVYFARVAGLVKIGTTRDLWLRMVQLGKPELLGVIPGDYREERRHHRMFADENVHGEVFEASPRLLSYVAEHTTLPTPPEPKRRPPGDPNWIPPSWLRSGWSNW